MKNFAQPKKGEFGITWLELVTLYRAMGYNSLINYSEVKAKARPSMGAQTKAFRLTVRRLVRHTIKDDQKQILTCGKTKGYALKRLGISSHTATLNCLFRLSPQVQNKIDREILKASGAKKHDLDDIIAGRKNIEVKKNP